MKSSILLRTLHHNSRLPSSCRFSKLSTVNYHRCRIQHYAPVCQLSKCFYSAKGVSQMEKIYEAPATKNVFMLKIISLTTSASAIVLEASLCASDVSVAAKFGWSMAGLFTFSTPLLAHSILRKYVIRIFYDATNDSYTAVIFTIFATKQYINFTLADIKPLDVEIMSTVRIKGRPMFFDSQHFTDINHYKRLLGYDKPIDLGIDFGSLKDDLETLRKSKAESENKTT